jgi:transcriptional regulator with PAS, ATPase and Fis domain
VQGGKEMTMETPDATDWVSAIVGECAAIRDLRSRIIRIVAVDKALKNPLAVLIVGETGTGKQLVAQALHHAGDRAHGPFIELNCAAIPLALLETELFGYEKGAFTDAKTSKPGLFEEAHGGTLFLDEISSMDPMPQVKLLKAIEEKSIRRVGSTQMKPVNVRIIAATNSVEELALQEGRIRPDLFYRLCAFLLMVPPLRERGTDILLLARHVLARIGRELGRPSKQLTREAQALLMQHSWPGNVRELIHVVERAALLMEGDALTAQDLEIMKKASQRPCAVAVAQDGNVQIDFTITRVNLEGVTCQLILKALTHVKWNRTQAARLLGISKETLRYRIEKFKLQPPPNPKQTPETLEDLLVISPFTNLTV